MDLFADVAPPEQFHPIYRMILEGDYAPERKLLQEWAEGFSDRDGKFVHEFQTTFEPCLWELYLHACLKELGCNLDFAHARPDFVVQGEENFSVEATIAAPAQGQPPPHGGGAGDIPDDFNEFNAQATLRICNSFTGKAAKYDCEYSNLEQIADQAFLIAIGAYDRPSSHMAAARPVISALYGVYHDEELTIEAGTRQIIQYQVGAIKKNENTDIPVGYFNDDSYSGVSAVMYSCLATWGKVRALANNPDALTVYRTLHPNPGHLHPTLRVAPKAKYQEHLLDGLWIFHNPFAAYPLTREAMAHNRVAQFFPDPNSDAVTVDAPDDFLLMRSLMSVTTSGSTYSP